MTSCVRSQNHIARFGESPLNGLDVQLLELPGVDGAGRAGHQVGSLGRLGERDAVADIGQARNRASPGGRRPARCRRAAAHRCAGRSTGSRISPGPLRARAQQGEDLGLDHRVVAADRAAAAFLAVDHQVIRLGPHLGRLGIEQMQVFEERHRERVVLGDEPLLLGVPGKEREPDDPRVVERFRVVQLELGRQPAPQAGKRQAGDRLGVGDDQDQVAGPGTEPRAELLLEVARRRTWRSGRSSVSASTLSQTRPLAPMPAMYSVSPSRSLRL